MAQRDLCSASDPYLYIQCGDKIINDIDNVQDDEPNPKWNKVFDFVADFPAPPILEISVYDYDLIFGDDLIGTTCIDLDDRFYNPVWQIYEHKPVEVRQLHIPSSKLSQGSIYMWLNIQENSIYEANKKEWHMEPEPDRLYEIRLSVYEI